MASSESKEKLKIKKIIDLLWFNDLKVKNEIRKIEANKNKTKILISLNREYSKEFLETLIDDGFLNFQIDGSRLTSKIYNKLVSHLVEYSHTKIKETPSIIFDLKSPLPLITKISGDRKILKISKGQTIKIASETKKPINGDVIFIDKKIFHGVNVGDILTINYPDLKFKIISIDNNLSSSASTENLIHKERTFLLNKMNKTKSSPYLMQSNNFNELDIYKQAYVSSEIILDSPHLIENDCINVNFIINENLNEEDEENFIDPNNFDNYLEDTLKHKHEQLEEKYHKIIRKHTEIDSDPNVIENNIEMNNISSISKIDISGSISFQSNSPTKKLRQKRFIPHVKNTNNKNKIIVAEALDQGFITQYKTIGIQGKNIIEQCDLPLISAKDINDLNQTDMSGINIISAMIEHAADIDEIKEILGEEARKNLKIFAKIDTKNGILNFNSIVDIADGIIIQNFLCPTSLDYSEMRSVVMYIIQKCKLKNKPIIVQMNSLKLMSIDRPMINKMSSLDFSVKEGIDSILVYEESTKFDEEEYLDVIRGFREILLQIEAYEDNTKKYEEVSKFFSINTKSFSSDDYTLYCLMDCGAKLSHEIKADLIILLTDTCNIVKVISQLRPYCIISIPVFSLNDVNYLRLFRGVLPYLVQNEHFDANCESSIQFLIESFKLKNMIRENIQKVIVVNAYSSKYHKFKNSVFVVNLNVKFEII